MYACIVVVVLAPHVPTIGLQQASEAVTDGGSAAMTHVQWTSRVGRYVLHADGLAATAAITSVYIALVECGNDCSLVGSGGHVKIDKAWAGNLDPGDVHAHRDGLHQCLG